MAIISKKSVWQKIPVIIETNTDTGKAEVFISGSTAGLQGNPNAKLLVMKTDNNEARKWDYSFGGRGELKRAYNKANPSNKTTNFSKEVYTTGLDNFNKVRAITLNDDKSYSDLKNPAQIAAKKETLVQTTFVPGVISNGQTVTKDGKVIPAPVVSPSPDPEDQNVDSDSNSAPPAPVLPAPGDVPDPEGTISATRGKSLGPGVKTPATLRYPMGQAPAGFPFDFIQITSYKYVPSGLDYINTPNKAGEGVESRYATEDPITTVSLPMQPNLSESHSVGWGGDSLDPIKAMLAGASLKAINNITSVKNIMNTLGDLGNNISSLATDPATRDFIKAYFAGQAVGANITGRTTGQVINPNMELLFNGPSLRTFNFQFRLTPRDEPEANMIRQIIKSFKANMAVQRSTSNLFLMSPNIFKLKYISGDGSTATDQHPFLNKFKPCAMTAFNVNYTPDGSYMTFENKSLTSYDISMAFSELEPIYQDDYTNDYNSNDMGF